MEARGYHGTSVTAAEEVLNVGFVPSRNRFDWLGDGVYFFQDSAARAREWAERQFGEEWAVIEASIDLDGCMDLLDPAWFSLLNETYDAVVTQHRHAGLSLPRQAGLAHGMDRAVINYAVGVLEDRGVHIRSVRGVFEEGRPAFPGSALFSLAHVQIAVRDLDAIRIINTARGGTNDDI